MASEKPTLTPLLMSDPTPELISDGGGLPFPPIAAYDPFEPLDPADPPVQVLLEQIELGRRQAAKGGRFRPAPRLAPQDPAEALSGWRALASAEDEFLYARGRPPQLLTVAVKRSSDKWRVVGVSNSRPLRAIRQGVRASSWRLDPEVEPKPDATELHILVTEQTLTAGRVAEDRILAPDLYIGPEHVVLRLYVKPVEGYTARTKLRETAVVVKLPQALGQRTVLDGALYDVRS